MNFYNSIDVLTEFNTRGIAYIVPDATTIKDTIMMNAMPMMNMMNMMPQMSQMPMMNGMGMMPMMMPMMPMMASMTCSMSGNKMVCEMSPMGSMTKDMMKECCDRMNSMMKMGMPIMMMCGNMMMCCMMPETASAKK